MIRVSLQVKNENDLVVYIGKYIISLTSDLEFYPIVKKISRNIEVTPDIDLLCIDRKNKITIGYEAKIVSYRKDWNRYIYDAIYRGIGQALLYSLYGIDKTHIVFAFFSNNDVPRDAIEKLKRKFYDMMRTCIRFYIHPNLGLKIMLFTENNVHFCNLIKLGSNQTFQKDRDFRFRKACLLRGEFTWNKKLQTKIYDYSYGFKYPIVLGPDWITRGV